MQQTDVAQRKISSKQLMQQSRKSHLVPSTAMRCNMLREAWCRSDVRLWLQTQFKNPRSPASQGSPRPTAHACDIYVWPLFSDTDGRHESIVERQLAGYFSPHPFIIHLFRGVFSYVGVLPRLFAQPGCWNSTLVCLPSCVLSAVVPCSHIIDLGRCQKILTSLSDQSREKKEMRLFFYHCSAKNLQQKWRLTPVHGNAVQAQKL